VPGRVPPGTPVGGCGFVSGGWLRELSDGPGARATGRSTPFGGFFDSVTDRLSDGLILGGMAWWLKDQPRLFILVVIALVGAEVTSYVRARAEAIDLSCSIGVIERAERAVLLMFGLVFHRWLLEPVLWILAVGSTVTVVQRIHHVWCQIDRDIPAELLELALHDRAWSRAFKAAARRFYGEHNFDPAIDELAASQRKAADATRQADSVEDATPSRDDGGDGTRRPPRLDEGPELAP
jgi:phosphatidylglycerophosphate synthase